MSEEKEAVEESVQSDSSASVDTAELKKLKQKKKEEKQKKKEKEKKKKAKKKKKKKKKKKPVKREGDGLHNNAAKGPDSKPFGEILPALMMEMLGTMWLVFLFVQCQKTTGDIQELAMWLAYSAAICWAQPFSGGHLNPMVTVGHTYRGKIEKINAIMYIAFQLLGCLLGAIQAVLVINVEKGKFASKKWSLATGGALADDSKAHVPAVVSEVMGALLLCLVANAVMTDHRGYLKNGVHGWGALMRGGLFGALRTALAGYGLYFNLWVFLGAVVSELFGGEAGKIKVTRALLAPVGILIGGALGNVLFCLLHRYTHTTV